MTNVRIIVSSQLGDVEIHQDAADYFGQGHKQSRRVIRRLLAIAMGRVEAAYALNEIEEEV